MDKTRTSIGISKKLKEYLKSRGKKGQTYEEVIIELIGKEKVVLQ